MPELEELQKQIALTNEELTDLQFQWNEDKAAAATRERALTEQLDALNSQLQVRTQPLPLEHDILQWMECSEI